MKTISKLGELAIGSGDRILVFMPHPDDEAVFVSGLLKMLTRNKIVVKVVVVTRGEASTLRYGLGNGDDLAMVRREETKKSMKILGIIDYEILDLGDGKLEENYKILKVETERQIKIFKPTILLTLEPDGIYGHPDHIALSQVVTETAGLIRVLYATIASYKVKPKASAMAKKIDINPLPPEFKLKLGVMEKLAKIRSLVTHKTQFNMTKSSANDSNFFRVNKMLDFEYFVYNKS